ncbi:MAG: FKBP-type peptidyl-prolyl cis-trans isomerase [Ferruginibacter sp.]
MRKISYGMLLLTMLAFSACQNREFKKGKNGIEYQIISSGSGDKIKVGEFMQIHVGQLYATGQKDSLLQDSRTEGGPLIEQMDSLSTPQAYFEILQQLRKGDSLTLRILTDSAFAKSPDRMPKFFKKGHYLLTTVKVLDVFKTRQGADSARLSQMKITQAKDSIRNIETMAKDDKTLQQYFTKNNIKAVKTPLGAYVEIIQPGTGPNIDTAVIALIKYTGRTIDGKEPFDSNTDSSKGRTEPLKVNMTKDRIPGTITVIRGWTDGLPYLNKGAKAKLYIPSALGYGAQSQGDAIPANSILIFDVEVAGIQSKEEAKAIAKEMVEKNKLKQKAFVDSMTKARSADSAAAAGQKK